MLSTFLCACWPSGCHLQRNVYLGSFFSWFFFFYIELYELLCVLEIKPLSVASFANVSFFFSILRVVFSFCLYSFNFYFSVLFCKPLFFVKHLVLFLNNFYLFVLGLSCGM